ncbi:hypothetical protein [Actinocorallia populi]|uniref:hypothetical protein n=1 Tax=Actinocorallia populi TaxID=2079200 RepID=UPI0013008427|nr:hypothetical protein [Actinocorallia populi]
MLTESRGAASPPPGLRKWPADGEVFVSPALQSAVPGIAKRYGNPAGMIDPHGLAHPGEWLVYVGASLERHDVIRVDGFGGPSGKAFPMELDSQDGSLGSEIYFVMIILFLALVICSLRLIRKNSSRGLLASVLVAGYAVPLLMAAAGTRIPLPLVDYVVFWS